MWDASAKLFRIGLNLEKHLSTHTINLITDSAQPTMPSLMASRTPCCVRSISRRCLYSTSHTTTSTQPRHLSATPKKEIPPESPKYIDVPRSVQPQGIYKPFVKGILPVPRKIFRRGDPDKTSPEYLAAVTPEPLPSSKKSTPDKAHTGFVTWKAQQAAARRRNLRESLVELRHRKERINRRLAVRSASKIAEHERLIAEPDRDDERFTSPSILDSMRPSKRAFLPDPNRAARIASKRANLAAQEAAKQEERRNALHTLYMNAGNFIVTEEHLNTVVDQAFDDNRQFENDSKNGLNIWNKGYPETVQEMLDQANRASGGKAIERNQGFGPVTKERMKRIGEELTGGKM